MAKISNKVIITGRDIIKGYTTKNRDQGYSAAYEMTPWQMLDLEDKTPEWKMWVADYFEYIGLRQVKEKYKKTIKNRRLAAGILDMEDYTASDGEFAHLTKWVLPEEMSEPFKKFYPLIPPYIKVLSGEFLKRDLRIFVTCTDRQTEDDKLDYKNDLVNKALIADAVSKKDQALRDLGIVFTDPQELKDAGQDQVQQVQEQNQQYTQQIDATKELATAQQKYKSYRHKFEEFGQLVLDKDYERFHMAELEREAFVETICNPRQCWHIDMLEDGYRVEFLDNAQVFRHEGPSIKYYSDGDYMGWFEDMSIGEVINKLGPKLQPKDFDQLQDILKDYSDNNRLGGRIIPDQEKGWQGAYYDTTKPYPQGRTNVPMEQHYQDQYIKDLVNNTTTTTMNSSELSSIMSNKTTFATPKMFRVMRLYFRSQRKIGWLTKKDRDGTVSFQDWVDENFRVTVEPVYDNSLTLDKTKENLAYGEHIDWEWGNEWRHSAKVNNNTEHTFWKSQTYGFDPIYLDGDRIKFQFTGTKDNPLEVYPPFEGVENKMKQTRPVSDVELLAPYQASYNIANNRVPDIMFNDVGMVMAFNKAIVNPNRPGVQAGTDPIDDWMDTMRKDKIVEVNIDPELLRVQGNTPLTPQILNYSRIREAIDYMNLARMIKEDAGQAIGISPQRLAQAKASETATGVQSNVNYSETQTETLFHQHIVEFMPRVYNRMLDAAQFYCTKSESARAFYQTSTEGNKFLEVENMEGVARSYHITCNSDIKESILKDKLQQLFLENNTTGATILELASGISSDSPQEILEILRTAQVEKEKKEQQQYEQQTADRKAQQDALDAAQKAQRDWQSSEKQLDRESQERIAATRELGGMQSDVNANKVPDSLDNLNAGIKNRAILTTQQTADNRLAFDKTKHTDTIALGREKLITEQSIEQKKLAIALANQNTSDDKALNRKIAKNQRVTG